MKEGWETTAEAASATAKEAKKKADGGMGK